jgi:hypothetical protein
MKIQKYHFWLLFFFFIFGYTFSLIVWTIKSAVNTPVYEDRSFMEKYQSVDDDYNGMFIKNVKFNAKYTTKVHINDRVVGMDFSDIQYGQRSLKKYSKNQAMLHVGENSLSLEIIDKKSNTPVSDANISFQITRPIKNDHDINLNNFEYTNGHYTTEAITLELKGYWNIIGKVTIGDNVGYLYIKTGTQNLEKE